MHFLRPDWFYALIPLLLVTILLYRVRLTHRGWQRFCDPRLLPFLLAEKTNARHRNLLWLFGIAGLLTITALAGPTWEQRPIPVFRQQSALVLILDLSASMNATDVKPSRLTRAKEKVLDILKKRREGQTALIVFAGDAFSVTPLTNDTATIASQVKSLSTNIMPVQGSNSNSALVLAKKLLHQDGQINGDILIVTDGINTASLETAKQLSTDGYRISVLAVGTQQGAPIPLPSGGFLKDQAGSVVIPKVNFNLLSQLADLGGGQIQRLTIDDRDINSLLAPISKLKFSNRSTKTKLNTDIWYEAGPYLLLLVLPLAAYAFRRGILAALLLVLLLPSMPNQAQAFELSSLWKNQNQQAVEKLKQHQAKSAAKEFTDPKWKAAALYKSGQYQQALKIYNQMKRPDTESLYNKANTLAKLGEIPQAIKTYNRVLKRDKQNTDAKYNRDLLKKEQKKQQQKNSSSSNKQQSDKNSKPSQQKQEQNSSSGKQQSQSDKSQNPSPTNQQQGKKQVGHNQSSENNKKKNASNSNSEESNPQLANQDSQQQDKKANKQQQTSQDKEDMQSLQDKQQQQTATASKLSEAQKEQQQANNQWLRRIPDDPGGLLRRKFYYQAQQQNQLNKQGQARW
jgi:Ca-activated chloride channel family protein